MALSYKARRRWSLVILLVGLPLYIGLSWFLLSLFERPSIRFFKRLRSGPSRQASENSPAAV